MEIPDLETGSDDLEHQVAAAPVAQSVKVQVSILHFSGSEAANSCQSLQVARFCLKKSCSLDLLRNTPTPTPRPQPNRQHLQIVEKGILRRSSPTTCQDDENVKNESGFCH